MKKNTINSLNEYLTYIDQIKDNYTPSSDVKNPIDNSFLFRGISNETYHLIPGVFRSEANGNMTYTMYANEIELLKAFIQEASAYLSIPSNDYARWAEYAQHFGVPTRFLDWSNNPLVALYFCCKNNFNVPGTVWVLNQANYERNFIVQQPSSSLTPQKTRLTIVQELFEGKSELVYPIVYTPSYVDSRMSVQGSYFMVWGNEKEPLDKILDQDIYEMSLYPQQSPDLTSDSEEKACLLQFCIPANSKKKILRSLDNIGINEKTLFPGLDGIGRYIESKFKFDKNDFSNF